MLKRLLIISVILLVGTNAFCNENELFINPAQTISTCYDEIELGDYIKFTTAKDFYKNGKIYIKKGTPVIGKVDYVNENSWNFDNAQIDFKYFQTTDIDGKNLIIDSPLSINGFEIIRYKDKRLAQVFNYCGLFFRGKEIEILPNRDKIEFKILVK